MWENIKNNSILTLLFSIGAVYFFLQYLSPLLGPGLVALVFVTAFGPFLQKIRTTFGIHRQVGAVLLLIFFVAVLGGIVALLYTFLAGTLPELIGNLEEFYGELEGKIHNLSLWLGNLIRISTKDLEAFFLRTMGQLREGITAAVSSGLMDSSLKMVGKVGRGLLFLGTFLISVVMFSKDYDEIMNKLLDKKEFSFILSVFCEILRYLATVVKAQLVIMPLIGSLCALVLTLLKVEHGIFWGILAGVLDAMPMIGTGIVLTPIGLYALFHGEVGKALVVLLLYVGCVLLREFLEPRLIGKQMGIPPIALLLAIYGGIKLFGPIGILKGPLGYLTVMTIVKKRRGEEQTTLL